MSELLKQIKSGLRFAMTAEVKLRKMDVTSGEAFDTTISQKTVSRAIISMFPEIGKKPAEATDADVIKLLKKYISQEKERSVYQLGYLKEKDVAGISASELKKLVTNTIKNLGDELITTNVFIAQLYLPKEATKEEITSWISENIDFSKFKNKMQAMKPIMQQFQGADGNFVKDILLNL